MRYSILIVSLLISISHHSLRAQESSNSSFYLFVVGIGTVAGLVDSIYKSVQEEKRKNELLEKSIKEQQFVAAQHDYEAYFKACGETMHTYVQETNNLIGHFKDKPDYKEQTNAIINKAVEVHQEISINLAYAQKFTRDELALFAVLKARGYQDIPPSLIEEIREYSHIIICGDAEFKLKISRDLLKNLQQPDPVSRA